MYYIGESRLYELIQFLVAVKISKFQIALTDKIGRTFWR